jgi:hypothetical protein
MGWSQDRISLVLESRKRQEIAIKAPSAIKAFDVTRGSAVAASTDDDNTWRITLPAKQRIAMEIRLA